MNFLSEKANELTPYVPGQQPKNGKYIKLNTNENPYPPSIKVIEAIKNANLDKLRLYPDPESTSLRETYAKLLGLEKENIFVGNGSDEVLATAFQSFYMGKNNILMPDITYSFYPVYCNLYNIAAKEVPLKEDYKIDINDYLMKNNGIVIANPNAPTGIALSKEEIETIIKNSPNSVILIDEAYVDFGGETVIPLVKKYNNLIVVRTLSKSYSLAGLRVGFGIGNKELVDGMNRVKNSFNSYPVDMLAQICSNEAINDTKYLNKTRNMIIATREETAKRLKEIGFTVLDSKTNFLFIIHKEKKAEDIFKYLKENRILVRYFKKPRLDNGIRVTIGTKEEMETFVEKIKEFVKE